MGSLNLLGRKVHLRLIGAAVAVAVVVLGVTTIKAVKPGGQVTECGVDAKGPYAKVRVHSLLGGLGMKHEGVSVGFTYEGHWYDWGGSKIKVPMFGSTTLFVRGSWPPRVINLNWDGGPKDEGKITVPGRVAGGHWVNLDPGPEYPNLRPRFKPRVEPDDKSLLGCEVAAPTNGWQ